MSNSKMPYKILIVHNRYIHRGGEDSVVDEEYTLLKSHGHNVNLYLKDNRDLEKRQRVIVAMETLWSSTASNEVSEFIKDFRPDIIHVHNFFPQISPSIFWTASSYRIPTVLTLHNFRYACAQGFLYRGKICESCMGRIALRGVIRRCYRGSAVASIVLISSFLLHKLIGTFNKKVSTFITLSDFSRRKLIECGLPADKLELKPNFVDMQPGHGPALRNGGLFVGRISREKGVITLLDALKLLLAIRVKVIGEGPEIEAIRGCLQMDLLGSKSRSEVYVAMHSALYLVTPSIGYENFPRTIVEAFACGLPVIASRLGPLPEIVEDFKTGFLFESGSAQALAEKILWAESHPEEMHRMGRRARQVYEEKYTPEKNYEQLISIYDKAIHRR